jgi:hypothetical protein
MTQISSQDIAKLVKEAGARFIGHPTCVANKPNMLEFVERLDEYTDEVVAAADEHGLSDDLYVPQWARDMNNWKLRLAGYYRALERAQYESGPESCEELRATVNEPLLVGWFQPGTPGIVNPEVQTVADIATPYMLGNQVVVYRDHQEERFWQLLADLNPLNAETREGILDYWGEKTGLCGAAGCWGPCDRNCWIKRVIAGVGVVGGVYLAYRGVKWAIKARTATVIVP